MKTNNFPYDEIWTKLYIPQLGNDIWVSSYGKIFDHNRKKVLRCAIANPRFIVVVLGNGTFRFDVIDLIIKAFNIDIINSLNVEEMFEYIWNSI